VAAFPYRRLAAASARSEQSVPPQRQHQTGGV